MRPSINQQTKKKKHKGYAEQARDDSLKRAKLLTKTAVALKGASIASEAVGGALCGYYARKGRMDMAANVGKYSLTFAKKTHNLSKEAATAAGLEYCQAGIQTMLVKGLEGATKR